MEDDTRVSAQALKVLKLFVEKPKESFSGAQISRSAGVRSGTLYPMLARFERIGWMKSEWETVNPSEVGRPRRRFYTITAVGQAAALKKFTEYQVSPEALAWN